MAQSTETLLKMVQDIAREMSSFVPNSISDTKEAYDIAALIQETYNDLVAMGRIPKAETQFRLVASGDNDLPCKMTIPGGVSNLYNVYYNKKTSVSDPDAFREVHFRTPREFMKTLEGRDSTDTNVTVMSDADVSFNIYTNKHPSIYTTLNHEDVYFDAHYSSLDTTLQASKTRCYGEELATFTINDTFTPSINLDTARLLKAEAKSRCFSIIKQAPNQKIEVEANRQRVFSQLYSGKFPKDRQERVNYGRRR